VRCFYVCEKDEWSSFCDITKWAAVDAVGFAVEDDAALGGVAQGACGFGG
jgi:hypothetical protein